MVTRSVDAVHFLGPITTQNIVILQACVNRAWKTSMEVGVRVITEDLLSADQRYCCHAYLTFVALPQPPLATLVPAPNITPHGHGHSSTKPDSTKQDPASRAALANSPAARRYSFSLPSASTNRDSKSNLSQAGRSIQLPAIEPITPIEVERYTMAQSRREARLQQSNEGKEAENKMLSDIRDQMRRWNVTQTRKRGLASAGSLLPHMGADGHLKVSMQSTFAESAQLVLPQHANSLSITFGGQVMKWMENVCAVSASRFARVPVVTASIDSLQFHRKTMIGDCLTMRSIVTRVFKSSMEVYVFVDSENLVTGKQTFTNEGFFSMVALQPSSTTLPKRSSLSLPELCPESDLEQALSDSGEQRRIRRLEQRRELAEREAALAAQSP
ncbi:Acyl-coenzyme A thioesterase 11 [Podila minutissima]|uniref:Acyl-coenzyme A thioesterase 11 n=1 Tax=Podila minutissima TaxID=64525 RepID=A0A9P5SL68_9FUNG|nr:Acyl-coenzyme A thioesterase 11 [Podila minutissima]